MDYNEDRQVIYDKILTEKREFDFASSITESDDSNHAFIYLDTIEPFFFIGEGEYNINVFKEINATDSFLGMDQDIRNCQTKESFDKCATRQYIDSILKECKC